jgi:hypothetical protein
MLEALLSLATGSPEVDRLLVELLDRYARNDLGAFGEDDQQIPVVRLAIDVLAQQARTGRVVSGSLESLSALLGALGAEEQDRPNPARRRDDFDTLREAAVQATRWYPDTAGHRRILVPMLLQVVRAGLARRSGQGPFVTAMAIERLGRIAAPTPEVIRSLVLALFGQVRGQSLYWPALVALARLPGEPGGAHPALAPLLLLVQGDPWQDRLDELARLIDAAGAAPSPGRPATRALEQEREKLIQALRAAPDAAAAAPTCPHASGLTYVCDLFWRIRQDEREPDEQDTIELRALRALEAFGDDAWVEPLVTRFGVAATRERWLRAARLAAPADAPRSRGSDVEVPGVPIQRERIPGYDRDVRMRVELLRALGRTNAAARLPQARSELLASLTWSGDLQAITTAASAAMLGTPDRATLDRLVALSRTAASYDAVILRNRFPRLFFWQKVVNGSCPEASTLASRLSECVRRFRPRPGDPTDASWHCLERFKPYWFAELRYAVRYHLPGDYRNLVHDVCRPSSAWWNTVRPELDRRTRQGGAPGAEARAELRACATGPAPPKGRDSLPRCGEWTRCDRASGYLCLDGHLLLRLAHHQAASWLAGPAHVATLLGHRATDLLSPHGLKKRDLPAAGRSLFHDPGAAAALRYQAWDAAAERARRTRAIAVIDQRLCQDREYLHVVRRCGDDARCYLAVVEGAPGVTIDTEDCERAASRGPRPSTVPGRPGWRARKKAIRRLADLAARPDAGVPLAPSALRAAVMSLVAPAPRDDPPSESLREELVLLLDRLGDLQKLRAVACRDGKSCLEVLREHVDRDEPLGVVQGSASQVGARLVLARLARRERRPTTGR